MSLKVKLNILLSLLFCTSCMHLSDNPSSLYRVVGSGAKARQCILPIRYLISSKFEDKTINIIKDQFDYWNKIANKYGKTKKIFIYSGNVERYSEIRRRDKYRDLSGIIVVRPYILNSKGKRKGTLVLEKTHYSDRYDGCTMFTTIYISVRLLSIYPETTVSTIRHGIGHALGFVHSKNKNDLMYPKYVKNVNKLNNWEINAFKIYY